MKKLILTYLAIIGFITNVDCQRFQMHISSQGNQLIILLKPDQDITNIQFSQIEFFLRTSSLVNFTISAPIVNTTNFPGTIPLGIVSNTTIGMDRIIAVGYAPGSSGTNANYTANQEYELARFTLSNGNVSTANFELIHNVDYIPYYLNITSGSGTDLTFGDCLSTSCSGANVFYGTNSSISGNTHVDQVQNVLLPIYLSTFSAKKYTERSSRLNWSSSSEINSDYFGIERSKDGNNWETIGRVAAAGNSSKELAYEFIDDKLPLIRSKEQVFYYRLRMTDLDGQYKYSDVRGINFGKLSEGVVTIYPNPTVEHINVDLSGMDLDAGKVDLFVYDMTGRQVIKKCIIGNGIELIDVSQLPANTYNVVVKQGETAYQQRVIKID